MTQNPCATERERIAILWTCLGLFFLRVLGQIEVWLLAPAWLPSMEYWYSGLVSYPLLLPAQIVLLMAMAVVVMDETRGRTARSARAARTIRALALAYFAAMLLRLFVQAARGADDALAAGGIPIAFHWVLALFLYELGRCPRVAVSTDSNIRSEATHDMRRASAAD
jgi:hypothetical protein